jgi:hypothetical protein
VLVVWVFPRRLQHAATTGEQSDTMIPQQPQYRHQEIFTSSVHIFDRANG